MTYLTIKIGPLQSDQEYGEIERLKAATARTKVASIVSKLPTLLQHRTHTYAYYSIIKVCLLVTLQRERWRNATDANAD